MAKNTRVCLRIDGVSHHLSKFKNYLGWSKHDSICANCSLHETHCAYCWSKFGNPICSTLARANDWDDDFCVYFKTIKRKKL